MPLSAFGVSEIQRVDWLMLVLVRGVLYEKNMNVLDEYFSTCSFKLISSDKCNHGELQFLNVLVKKVKNTFLKAMASTAIYFFFMCCWRTL